MNTYTAYGVIVASTVPIPHLMDSPRADPNLMIRHRRRAVSADGWKWRERVDDGGRAAWLSVGKRRGSYRLRFESGGDFVVSDEGRHIAVHGAPPSVDVVAHLLLDQVIPLALSQAHKFVLHASAIRLRDGAGAAFAGPAGAGKSTLAAAFGAQGAALIADDALVVEPGEGGWTALPAYPGARLWPDAVRALSVRRRLPKVARYTSKRRIGPREGMAFVSGGVPLRRVYLLRPHRSVRPRVEIRPATGREAAIALVSHSYLLDVDDPIRVRAQFARAADAWGALDVRVLTFRRGLAGLPGLRDAVLADLDRL